MIFLIGFALCAAVVVTHYEALRWVSVYIDKKRRNHRHDMLIIVGTVIAAHLFEALMFAAVYWFRAGYLHLDQFHTDHAHRVLPLGMADYFYFSLETYTTLGYGDLYLLDNARFLSSFEGLLGLLMLGWSTSFILLILKERWDKISNNKT